MSVLTEERVDLESELQNKLKHFRTTHFECRPKMESGWIIEANCGVLYRTSGRSIGPTARWWRCTACIAKADKKTCPVCHTI